MLDRPTSRALPRQRMSPAALAATGALHVALVWLLLQHTPLQQVVRSVVWQTVRPAQPPPASTASANSTRSASSRAISPGAGRGAAADEPPLLATRPESSLPLETTLQLPDTLQPARPKARRQRRQQARQEAAQTAAPQPALRSESQLSPPAPPQAA
ncbi:MAG: hypothetical protein JWP65_205, partial [Ramlibacter sp.]|nr:hypothetical protein [Ramlibacter sp.]